jgi:hypothetical protein
MRVANGIDANGVDANGESLKSGAPGDKLDKARPRRP